MARILFYMAKHNDSASSTGVATRGNSPLKEGEATNTGTASGWTDQCWVASP